MPDFRTYIRKNLPSLNVSGEREAEIVEELALEFEESYERAIRNGATPEEAWAHVVKYARPWQELAEELQAELRQSVPVPPAPESRTGRTMFRYFDDVRHDLRYAARQLSNSPGFALVAILTLALGIGANSAIFSLLNAVVFRELPVKAPEELVFFGDARGEGSTGYLPNGRLFSYGFFREFQEKSRVFSDVAAIQSVLFGTHGRIAGRTELEKIGVELVSGNYFNAMGLRPVAGRLFSAADDRTPGAHPVAVASYSLWESRLAGSPSIIGDTVTINSTAYTIVGVAPPGFFGVTLGRSPDLWIPLSMQKEISPAWHGLENKRFLTLHFIARLKPGVTAGQAEDETTSIYRQIAGDHAALDAQQRERDAIQRRHIELTPAATGRSRLREQFFSPLTILMAVVALVLLIACANIANILLARALVRQREIAIRMSQGAERLRLIRQLLLESSLLAVAGAVVGVFFAWGAGRLLLVMVSTGSETLPIRITPDITVLAFTLVVTIITVLLFGTAPAFSATRMDVAPSLKDGRGATSSPTRNRLARGLVVAQVALSLVLLVSAGLFLRSLANLLGVNTGFNKENVLVMAIDPPAAGYQPDARLDSMMTRLEERVSSIRGVVSTSFVFYLFDGGAWRTDIEVPSRAEAERDVIVTHNIIGTQFFDAMRLPIVLGRGFDARDNVKSRKVAVINETMAAMYFNNSALGRTFGLGDDDSDFRDLEVIGVVKDAKYLNLEERPAPAAYYPHSQHLGGRFLYTFIARYTGDPELLVPEIRTAVHEIDPNLPLGDVTTLARLVEDSVVDKRLVAQLSTFFGVLAAFLACLGIYGVMSYGIAQRTNEFGLRMALGATRPQILWVVLRETLWLAMIGIAVGLRLAVSSVRLIESSFFGIQSDDLSTLALSAFALIGVALFAGYLPARRATRIDPMVALRHE